MEKIKYQMCRYFILFTLSFLGGTGWAMNPMPNKDGWRVRSESSKKDYQTKFHGALEGGDVVTIKDLIETEKIPLNESWLILVLWRMDFRHYPIEYVIYQKYPAKSLEALLQAGSPADGFADYNPIKDIFMKLNHIGIASHKQGFKQNQTKIDQKDIDLYIDYIKILLKYNANIDLPFPAHNGFAKDIFPDLIGTTAREFAQNSKLKLPNSKDTWNTITGLFNQNKSLITAPTPTATITPTTEPTKTTATPSLSASSAQSGVTQGSNLSAPNPPQGHGTPSATEPGARTSTTASKPALVASTAKNRNLYNATKTFFADKTSFATIAITAVILAALRLVYKNLISQDEQDLTPATITITNNTGSTIHVEMYNADHTVNTTTLIDGTATTLTTYWSAPVYVLSGSMQQKSRTPLSITLVNYKSMQKSEFETVHISITKASFLQRWLSGSPYTYSARWQ